MIHPEDYDAMEKLFRGQDIPDDLVCEYEIWQKMSSAYGHAGALGMHMVVPMMRMLGYGKVVERAAENVDWRKHIGEEVIALYGDQRVAGKVVGLGSNHLLAVELQGYGVVDLPRYCLQLIPSRELEIAKDAWSKVKRGTKVLVQTVAGPAPGKFVEQTVDGLRITVRGGDAVYPVESVELSS